MGTKQRRERERQATRQGILDGARQIGREEGWAALTIRKVADHIEYSPSIVYEYFDSKEAILQELQREGFRQLATAMRQAQVGTGDPSERIALIARAYWQFAAHHPDLYQVMHSLQGVSLSAQGRAEAVQEVCAIAMDALVDWATALGIELADPLGRTEVLWCLLHGMISLTLIDQIESDAPRAQQLVEETLRDLLWAWSLPGGRSSAGAGM